MGLFDFLKKPESAPATPGAPTPGATPAAANAAPAQEAAPAKSGPRYQGSKYVAPAEPTPQIPPMPPMPAGLQGQGPLAQPEAPEFPFEPQNILEHLLLLAPIDENARPAFYQALLQENILMVLAPDDNVGTGEVQLTEGQQIQLQVLQDGRLPIFTSEARLSDGGMDASTIAWTPIPGQAFFAMTQGQDCVLNPFSPAGKLLPAAEIQALLMGQLGQGGGLPADAQVTLSAPELPEGLGESLARFGADNADIRAIYVAQMQLAGDDSQPPRLLLGFDTISHDPDFMQQLGPALEGRTGTFQHVDLMLLDLTSQEGVNPYFQQPEVQPIYTAS
ncbi:enhanced serine sensitivity protein SseB C-terminal domain-containing protein [Hymenobacter cheonanensis]|uniref:enhanced serine sensitivity protein SseB C-terminal domain-containing protein n=1 Tax=Hymenobacter sp. CA2-7 TaxID=3063993 RepID=UPI0027140B49|nr:enhanced serine sensitivity protein SseB C-terminal domain-containing protein [Hymenobacter sp. CA2-7]MDO7886764.1 enhanced serine sensitivity protein SseB C-terminal domain-containing protein [Hymenobacter sp. CA2-7]